MITAQLGRKDTNYKLNCNEKLHPFGMESLVLCYTFTLKLVYNI